MNLQIKAIISSIFYLHSVYGVLTPTGYIAKINCVQKINDTTFLDKTFNVPLKELNVKIEGIEFKDENYDPKTRTLHLSILEISR